MTNEEALSLIEQLLKRGRLTRIQEIVFCQSWEEKTYTEIARKYDYHPSHIKDTGAELWQLISKALGEKITKRNLRTVLTQNTKRVTDSNFFVKPHTDWGEAIDVSHFYGRTHELDILNRWILQDRCRVVALLGIGGIGKTALSVKLAEQLQGEFEYIIWRSLRYRISFKEKVTDCISFLSNQQMIILPTSSQEQITCLIEYLRKFRCLLILDNFDTLLQPGKIVGCYREGCVPYGEMLWRLGETHHQSCLIITSREKPVEIAALGGDELPVRVLTLGGIEVEAGQTILRLKGLSGTESETMQIVQYYQGNPLSLKIAATSIRDLYKGSIPEFFAQGTAVFNGIEILLDQQFRRLTALEQQAMYWLAINRETVSLSQLQADLQLSSKQKLMEVLESLCRRSLIEYNVVGFTQQIVVMEYVTESLIEQISQEIVTETLQYFLNYALLKAQAKDYIRDSQICLLVQPVLGRVRDLLGSFKLVEQKLGRLIIRLQGSNLDVFGYGGGNLLNLLAQLEIDLTGYDFSRLNIRQADLRNLNLHQVKFTEAKFQDCAFASTFGGITCVAFSPDGDCFATSDTNGEINIWNTSDCKQLATYKGHNSWVWSVTFSPMHPVLASGGQDHTIKLWDTITGQCFYTLQGHTSIVTEIAFSPNAEFLASSSTDRTIKIWHLPTRRCVQTLTGHDACVWSVVFHPDGQTLLTGAEDNKIKRWNLKSGCCIQTIEGHQHWVKSVAVSPDGKWLISGSFDSSVKLWDLQSGDCIKRLNGHTGVVTAVAFSSDNRLLASSSYDRTVKIWNASTGKCLKTLEKHTNRVWSVTFHPYKHLLASSGDDLAVKVWDTQTGQCARSLQGHSNAIYAIAYRSEQYLLASAHEDQSLKLWDLNLRSLKQSTTSPILFRTLLGHSDRIFSVVYSSDGQFLASSSADRTVKLWNPRTGKCLNTLLGHNSWVWAVAFHQDNKLLASASYDHTIKLWDVHSGKCLQTLLGHPSSVLAIAFSPDGRLLISGGYEQTIKLWDIETGECLTTWQAHTNRVWAVAFSPNNKYIATGGDDQTVKIWDMNTGVCHQTLRGHNSQVLCVKFTSNSNQLISSSADCTLKIWEVNTADCLTTLSGHQNWVWSFNFALDAQTILSGSQDGTIRCWDTSTNECRYTLRVPRPYEGMNIARATGLTEAEMATLKALGAL